MCLCQVVSVRMFVYVMEVCTFDACVLCMCAGVNICVCVDPPVPTTSRVDFRVRNVVINGTEVSLHLWDTLGSRAISKHHQGYGSLPNKKSTCPLSILFTCIFVYDFLLRFLPSYLFVRGNCTVSLLGELSFFSSCEDVVVLITLLWGVSTGYYREATGVIVVYDVTDRKSFDRMSHCNHATL